MLPRLSAYTKTLFQSLHQDFAINKRKQMSQGKFIMDDITRNIKKIKYINWMEISSQNWSMWDFFMFRHLNFILRIMASRKKYNKGKKKKKLQYAVFNNWYLTAFAKQHYICCILLIFYQYSSSNNVHAIWFIFWILNIYISLFTLIY